MSYLRPIAPLNNEDMPRPDPYAASCNPPRQAKRQRIDTSLSPITGPSIGRAAAAAEQSATSAPSPPEDDPAPKRRGRKASSNSRAAREAQRKMNHSIIEKARRTKINDALATLRVLVPAQLKRRGDDEDDEEELQEAGGKEEKEFKLDVLVRTVTYLQELTERVKALEASQSQGTCIECQGLKRKRDCYVEEVEKLAEHPDDRARQQPSPSESSTRLPSIASWLPLDPSLMHKSSTSPRERLTPSSQLPSPPSSTTFRPRVSTQIPPTFALPRAVNSISQSTSGSEIAHTSPILSPHVVRTPEDESVASLLLSMGASSRRSSSFSEHPPRKASVEERLQGDIQPWTPASMLGLTKT